MNSDTIQRHKERKEGIVASWEPGGDDSTDVHPTIEIIRDGHLVASILCPADRDAILIAAQIAIPGYGATEALLCMDSFTSNSATNPDGERWKQGEMQDHFLKGTDGGTVSECLVLMKITKGGEVDSIHLPYRVDFAEKKVLWDEPRSDFLFQGGMMKDHIDSFFQMPSLRDSHQVEKLRQALDVDRAHAKLHIDIAITKLLLEHGTPVMFTAPKEDWAEEIVATSLGGYVIEHLNNPDEGD